MRICSNCNQKIKDHESAWKDADGKVVCNACAGKGGKS
jgi:formylmethanofuran dehydrogenase subunit E